jgi:hypothetical protein
MHMDQSSPDFGAVLKDALSLPADDRRRLTEVMQRVAPAGPQVPGSVETVPVAPQPEADLQGWLDRIEAETAWTRLQLLEDALDRAETDEEVAALAQARRALLDANPPVAMRRAVVELATNHPTGIVFGALGIVIAIATLGRGAWRLVF